VPFITDVTVYGVEVPNHDGRAGMASIVIRDANLINWQLYHAECVAHLPPYARPLFIRIQNQIQTTATFKHQKSQLVEEGFRPPQPGDDVYLYNVTSGVVVLLTNEIHQHIQAGTLKF
jgi:acyl-CoA synthetase (AMP-forming)/AMP-acid ligase II